LLKTKNSYIIVEKRCSMNNKFFAFFTLVVLGCAYLFLVFLVWITRGKKRALVRFKIKTGIHILFFAGALSLLSCESCITRPFVTCYKPAMPVYLIFDQVNEEYQLEIPAGEERILEGIVEDRITNSFVFELMDDGGKIVQEGEVSLVQGTTEDPRQRALVEISPELPAGSYTLIIYALHENGEKNPVYSNNLIIL
jgi:hypothetical protein